MNAKNRLFITSLSLVMIVGMLFVLVTPALALGSQSWNLDSFEDQPTLPSNLAQMEQTFTSGDDGQTGQIDLAPDANQIWIADRAAQSNTNFIGGDGAWILELVTDTNWQADIIPTNCIVEIGEWDGFNFHAFISTYQDTPDVENIPGNPNQLIITLTWQAADETIHKDCYLAIRVTNTDGQQHTIYCGEDEKSSCLTSTGTDPGYPNPPPPVPTASESGILIMILSFSIILPVLVLRRRQSVH